MARPIKPVKREERITIRFTKTEIKAIDRITGKAGLDRTDYIRNRSLNYTVHPRLTPEEAAIYRQLAGMANNLNQLAKAANKRDIMTRQILKALEGINEAITKLGL